MRRCKATHQRRGVIAVITLVLMAVMIGFAALTVDVGAAYNTKGDLQDAADSAALAAAWAYTTDAMMLVRAEDDSIEGVLVDGLNEATLFAADNPSLGLALTNLGEADIDFGWLDLSSATSGVNSDADEIDFNAVSVIVRRTSESANGPLDAIFSRIWGNSTMEVAATATASFDDRVAGFDTNYSPGLLPFSIHEDLYQDYLVNGDDDFEWDDGVYNGSDGIREVNLFPHNTAPGNNGLLNIGTPNMGTPALRDHIEDGVPPEDFEAETGSAVLMFDDGGTPQTYTITGNPGLVASLASSVETRVGDVVGYFLHETVSGSGANTQYTINRVVFGRVMGVQLNGNPSNRGLWIQPTTNAGGGVILAPDAPSSGGNSGRLVISR